MSFIGDRTPFSKKLRKLMENTEQLTRDNPGLQLAIAVNYGGRWDIAQAARQIAARVQAGELALDAIDADLLGRQLSLAVLPEPDLFIRTGGEQRISNFLLWQLAYTELYFTDTLCRRISTRTVCSTRWPHSRAGNAASVRLATRWSGFRVLKRLLTAAFPFRWPYGAFCAYRHRCLPPRRVRSLRWLSGSGPV